jgi:hypothetical protein
VPVVPRTLSSPRVDNDTFRSHPQHHERRL